MSQINNLKPVYLLAGPQALLIERFIDEIKLSIKKSDRGYQHFTFYSESDSIEEILGKANTYSIFQETNLIIIKNCEKLKKSEITLIENYIDSPSPDTFIVLFSNETNKPRIKKHNNLESKIFKIEDQMEKSVIKEAELLGINLTHKAAHELYKLIGDDLKTISNELLKLSQYFRTKEVIDDKDIQGFISKRNHEDIFQLINSIAGKDKKTSIKILNELKYINYDPVSIVSALSWRFRQIWHLKELSKTNMNENEIVKELKVSAGAVYYLKKHAGNFSFRNLTLTMNLLSRLDNEIKSYSQDKYNLISRFIFRVCRI